MQKAISDAAVTRGWSYAIAGLVCSVVGGLFAAQAAGGGDREFFLSIGFLLGAVGLLGIVIGGVAVGIQLARDESS